VQILNKLISYGIEKITFTGGEALLYEGLWSLIEMAKKAGVFVQLNTNAKSTDVDFLKNVAMYVDCLSLPLDSTSPCVQYKMGRNQYHVDNVVGLLNDIVESDIPTNIKINTVVTQVNYHEILNIVPLLKVYGIDIWKVFQFAPLRYNAKEYKNQLFVTDDAFYEIEQAVKHSYAGKTVFQKKNGFIDSYLLVTANGNVIRGDGAEDRVIGNVRSDSLDQILQAYNFNFFEHKQRKIAM
jgi:MoaA/NifB/PqqE/SkfB family radical SAM enzyme